MFSAKRSYSSKTSCSRGVGSSLAVPGSVVVDSEGSISKLILKDGARFACLRSLFSYEIPVHTDNCLGEVLAYNGRVKISSR
jgi:hypothetical protein